MTHEDQWFKRQSIVVNKLGSIIKKWQLQRGLLGRKNLQITVLANTCFKLSENNISANQIMQITGHKNIQSINNFSSLNELQHRNISSILSNPTAPQRSSGSVTFQFTQNNTASRNTLNNSGATSTTINLTGGVQNLVNGNIFGRKILVN